MKKLDDPENFSEGDSREELTALGEGQKITVVAYLLVAKPELGGESCNCGLQTVAETDNHLVLVTKATVQKFPLTDNEEANKQVFLDLPPKMRQPVKRQNPWNGENESWDCLAGGLLGSSSWPRSSG